MARTATKQTLRDAAGPPPAQRPRPRPPGGKRRSEAERAAILAEVEALLDYGAGLSAIMKALPHVPKRTLEEYMAIATAQAKEENAARREARKPFALRRAYAQLRQLLIERDPPQGPKPDARAKASLDLNIARIEERIARLEGTYAPEVLKVVKRTGWEDLTEEQLEEFQRTGIPPAGVNAEDLLRVH